MRRVLSDADLERIRDALLAAGYDVGAVPALLGDDAAAALARLFLLGHTEPESAVAAALPLAAARRAGLVEAAGDGVRAALDLRPYGEEGVSWWVVSDLGSDVRPGPLRPDHVLGVGSASVTLARATVRRPVRTALDVGTGCGVQALHLSRHAGAVTATDVLPRALELARLTARLNRLDWELLPGDLLDPVAGRRFDLIVANPPFVVGPGDGGFAYRDSGLAGDEVCRRLVRRAPAHLADGGWCQLLANWVHVAGEPWQDRLAGWLAGSGCDAWVWQREIVDPARYAALWLADAGERGSPGYEHRYDRWLEWFAAAGVEAVGFGLVTLHRSGAADPTVRIEDVPQQVEEPVGPHVGAWFDRLDALRGADLPAVCFRRAPGLLLEQVAEPGPEGWVVTGQRLRQPGGLRRTAEVDDAVAALVAGCDGSRPLGELAAVLQLAYGVDATEVGALTAGLAEQGFLVPDGVPAVP
jgi:methylase of polypeptide subunit release factors